MEPAATPAPEAPATPAAALPETPGATPAPVAAQPAAATPAPEAAPAPDTTQALIDTMFATGDDEPAWVGHHNLLLEREGTDSWSLDGDLATVVKDPAEAIKFLHNVRRLGLKGRDQNVRDAKELATKEAAMALQRRQFDEEKARIYAVFQDDRLKVAAPEGEAPDPYSDLQGYIDHQFAIKHAKATAELMKNLGTVSDEFQEKAAAAVQLHQRVERLEVVGAFMDSKEDFADHADEIEAFLKRVGNTIPVEEVYDIIRAQKGIGVGTPEDPAKAARRRMQRPSSGRKTQVLLPPEKDEEGKAVLLDGHELQQWFQTHPGSREAWMERERRAGNSL